MTTATLPQSLTPLPESAALPGQQPAWGVALLYPSQGQWSKYDYLDLPGNRLVEFDNGRIEVLPLPTIRHQIVSMNIAMPLSLFVDDHARGTVLFAPMPLQIAPLKFREPDVIFTLSTAPQESADDKYLDSAELVIEIISEGPENRKRDLVDKRADYAAASIPEYWLVDPESQEVLVLQLRGSEYVESGTFGMPDVVQSTAVPGFEIPVAKIFAK